MRLVRVEDGRPEWESYRFHHMKTMTVCELANGRIYRFSL